MLRPSCTSCVRGCSIGTPDAAELVEGIDNLHAWLEVDLDQTLEGYPVESLEQAAVDALDSRPRDASGLRGAAVGYASSHAVEPIAQALVGEDQTVVFPETYDAFERTFLSDVDCFLERSCDRLEVRNVTSSSYALGLEVSAVATAQFLWVEGSEGLVLISRSWLDEPARVNFDWLDIEEQYYLSALLPRDGGSVRVQATWVRADIDSDVPEDTALQMVIGSMKDAGDDLDTWLGVR